MTLFFIK